MLPFGELKFEKINKASWEAEKAGYRKLTRFIEENADQMKGEGFPIGHDGRISPEGYSGVYSQEALLKDSEKVLEYERKFDELKLSTRDVENSDAGEGFEILTLGIMQKFLDKDFYAIRASKFDDYANGVDILILDKRTGTIICGLDDVQDEYSGYLAERKINKARVKNEKYGGARVQYGFVPHKEDGREIKFKLGGMDKVPIIIFPVSGREVENAIENFNTNSDQIIFDKFLDTMRDQLGELSKTLPDKLSRERMSALNNSLNMYAKKKELAAV